MPSQVPVGMADWVDSMVLMCVSLVDFEFCTQLRQFHSVCSNSGDEKNYELVPPSSDERVCFSTRVVDNRPFFYAYDFFFGQLGVTLPFSPFEIDLLWSCNVAPSQLHPNSWGFIKIFQLLCDGFGIHASQSLFFYLFVLTNPGVVKKKSAWVSFRSTQGKKVFSMFDESFRDFKNYFFKVRAVEGARPFFLDEIGTAHV